jgi:hypothetical protein
VTDLAYRSGGDARHPSTVKLFVGSWSRNRQKRRGNDDTLTLRSIMIVCATRFSISCPQCIRFVLFSEQTASVSLHAGGVFTARCETKLLNTVQVSVSLVCLSGFRRRAKESEVSLAVLNRSLSNLGRDVACVAFPYRCTVRDFRLSSWMS